MFQLERFIVINPDFLVEDRYDRLASLSKTECMPAFDLIHYLICHIIEYNDLAAVIGGYDLKEFNIRMPFKMANWCWMLIRVGFLEGFSCHDFYGLVGETNSDVPGIRRK